MRSDPQKREETRLITKPRSPRSGVTWIKQARCVEKEAPSASGWGTFRWLRWGTLGASWRLFLRCDFKRRNSFGLQGFWVTSIYLVVSNIAITCLFVRWPSHEHILIIFDRIERSVSALVLIDLGVKPVLRNLLLAKRFCDVAWAFAIPLPPILDGISRRISAEEMSQTPCGALVEYRGPKIPKRAKLTAAPALMALPMPEPPVPHGLRCVPRNPAELWWSFFSQGNTWGYWLQLYNVKTVLKSFFCVVWGKGPWTIPRKAGWSEPGGWSEAESKRKIPFGKGQSSEEVEIFTPGCATQSFWA